MERRAFRPSTMPRAVQPPSLADSQQIMKVGVSRGRTGGPDFVSQLDFAPAASAIQASAAERQDSLARPVGAGKARKSNQSRQGRHPRVATLRVPSVLHRPIPPRPSPLCHLRLNFLRNAATCRCEISRLEGKRHAATHRAGCLHQVDRPAVMTHNGNITLRQQVPYIDHRIHVPGKKAGPRNRLAEI
jgi:hypothetical protein